MFAFDWNWNPVEEEKAWFAKTWIFFPAGLREESRKASGSEEEVDLEAGLGSREGKNHFELPWP